MNHIKLLITLCLALILVHACDHLDLNERFTPITPDPSATEKNVLIEDFTGQRCSNCPLAHEEVERLQFAYGRNRVIAVAIHGGPQAVDETSTTVRGLANEEGKEYNRRLGTFSYPKGRVDRRGELLDIEKWNTSVLSRLSHRPEVKLQITDVSVNTPPTSSFPSARKGSSTTGF